MEKLYEVRKSAFSRIVLLKIVLIKSQFEKTEPVRSVSVKSISISLEFSKFVFLIFFLKNEDCSSVQFSNLKDKPKSLQFL